MPAVMARPGLFDEKVKAGDPVRLRASRCRECGRTEFPGLVACPACGSATAEVELPEEATLVGFTAVLYPPPGSRVEVPYGIGVARFADEVCILGLMDPGGPELEIGMMLRTVAIVVGDDLLTYAYQVS